MKVLDQGWRNDNPKGWLLACLKGSVQAAENYELARWYGQPKRVVVAVEKQALEGPFEQVCQELEVDLAVCRGYPSISFLKEMSDVMRDSKGRENVLLYFGDHDASGQDIPRAVREDLGPSLFHNHFEYERIALNPEQVSEYNLDPAPLKLSDSRASGFAEKFGDEVYELDAIEPNALQDIIRDAVNEHFDDDIFEDREGRVEKGKKLISGILKRRGVHKLLKELEEGVGDTEDTDDEDSDDDDSDDDEGSDDDE
ncbi:MAG: hypothetical protein KGJ23_07815 [Euryarchaeota archaeon]|nr:hypothetical protein [Euryarchaeota archaeon]MDE1836506.1 hypothetical protein [Euryarchaeota archaeon]MDE1879299.1 hypothetical protein [Euryarchaeota archaeon]MDE2044476.1 hypothetical protein [Thermoplasmata archaeon]